MEEKNANKKTVVVGATPNPGRYAYLASQMLSEYGYEFIPVGIKQGVVFGQEIVNLRDLPKISNVHTITLYIGPDHQEEWYDYLLSLHPKRIIFNPGTENIKFEKMAEEKGIEAIEACTLVMLRTGQF